MRALYGTWVAVGCMAVLSASSVVRGAVVDYASYFLYLGEDPRNTHAPWLTGLDLDMGHSDTHWFITHRGRLGSADIWRIPVTDDLGSVDIDSPGVTLRGIPAELLSQGYRWFGKPGVFRFNGTDYLLVPMGSELFSPQWYRLGVFRGDESLSFIGLAPFGGSSWCSVDSTGNVYGSVSGTPSVWTEYRVNWPLLHQTGTFSLQLESTKTLYQENGVDVETIGGASGVVTANGSLLYMSIISEPQRIHIYDTSNGRFVRSSSTVSGPFYLYMSSRFHSIQGFTVWDLEGTGSPHQGQLHVLVHDNNPHDDNEGNSLKHYTRIIRVDAATSGGLQYGTPEHPIKTLAGAVDFAWDGAEVRIRAGAYNETMRIDRRIRMTAEGGTVRIGD